MQNIFHVYLRKAAYRIKNKANTTPIITIMQEPSVPPTITGKVFGKEVVWKCSLVSGEKKNMYSQPIQNSRFATLATHIYTCYKENI